MQQPTIITYLNDDQALSWKFDPEKIEQPFLIVANPSIKGLLDKFRLNACVKVVYREYGPRLLYPDIIRMVYHLAQSDLLETDTVVFMEEELISRSLSFEFCYADIANTFYSTHEGDIISYNGLARHIYYCLKIKLSALEMLYNLVLETDRFTRSELAEQPPVTPLIPVPVHFPDINLAFNAFNTAPKLHVLGDSHVLSALTPNEIIGCRSHIVFRADRYYSGTPWQYQISHHLGSKTMYGFSHGEEYDNAFIKTLGIGEQDFIVFSLGEIDIRSHVFKHVNESETPEKIIEKLTANFFDKITTLQLGLPAGRIAVMGVIPPMDGPNYVSELYPIQGTLAQRVVATAIINRLLSEQCEAAGYRYFEINEFYTLPDGSLDIEKSDLFCHINHHYNAEARLKMVNALAPEISLIQNEMV